MKIVFNTGQIYLHGGIEKTLTEKANFFADLPDTEVFIVTTEQNGRKPCYSLNDKIKIIDLQVNYNRSKSYFSLENIKKAIKHFSSQNKLFRKLNPDVVISPNFNFDHYWLPFLISKKNTKLIKERHASYYSSELQRKNPSIKQKVRFIFNDWIEKKYNHIVVLNEDEKKYVKTNNAVVIPNSVSIPDFSAQLDNKLVIAAGRIAPVKAFDELIHIWKSIASDYPDWQLHIYGDDYLETKLALEKQIIGLGLEKSIFFKDSVSNLLPTMQDYSIYAMTSLTECFPMVLLESLSVGLPIISYDCPNGPRNIISHNKDGILVDNKDRGVFADALREMMKNSDMRKSMGENAKLSAVRFSTPIVMKSWEQLLKLRNV